MPVFEYKALDQAGKPIRGLLEADSPKTLRSQLRKDGMFLTEVLGQAEGGRAAVRKGANAAQADREVNFAQAGRAAASPPTTSPSPPASSPRCWARA